MNEIDELVKGLEEAKSILDETIEAHNIDDEEILISDVEMAVEYIETALDIAKKIVLVKATGKRPTLEEVEKFRKMLG